MKTQKKSMLWFASIVAMAAMLLCTGRSVSAHAAVCASAAQGNAQAQATRYVDDVAAGVRWAIVPDCSHPQWPATLVELPPFDAPARDVFPSQAEALQKQFHTAPKVLVHSGAHVVLWSDSANTRMSLDAIALESGELDHVISLRLVSGGAIVSGTIRGVASAQLQLGGRTRRLP